MGYNFINFEKYKIWVHTDGNDYDMGLYQHINANIYSLLTGHFSKWY